MKKYEVSIKLIAPYLQARFSDESKASLGKASGMGNKPTKDDAWKKFLYQDEKGIYVPKEHIKGALVNGGKGIKKKPYGSFKDTVKAYFFLSSDKIYLGKKKPDFVKESHPPNSQGNRVRVIHPGFDTGTVIKFSLDVTNDDLDGDTIKAIIQKAGLESGIGAWRPEHGRFQLLSLKEINK